MKYLFLSLLLIFKLSDASAQVKVGEKAPEIKVTHWIKNAPQSKSLKGKFIVIDFWATWCAPCLESMPHMNNLVSKNKAKTNLVFLAMTDESEEKVDRLLKKVNFASAVVSDVSRQTFDDYHIRSIPYSVLIDDKGMVGWQGNPGELTNEIIDAVMTGKPIPAADGKPQPTVSEEVDKLYSALSNQYSTNFRDQDLKEYFSLTSSLYKQSTTVFNSKSSGYYHELVIGDSLATRLSSILDVAAAQIKLPEALAKSYVSYLYKSNSKVQTTDLLNALLDKLNLKYTQEDVMQDVIQLEVADMALFKTYVADTSVPKVAHTSNSETYIGLDNDKFFKMARAVQDKFNNIVVVKPESLLNTAVSITIKYDTMANLIESLRTHGIAAKVVKQKMPVYKFEVK